MFNLRHRINRLKIKMAYRLGMSRITSMPKMISIDPTNHCNLKCPLCPTGLGDKTVDRGLMSLDRFKSVINRLGTWLQSVNMYSWGEPLLNKSLVDMIRYSAAEHGIRTITSVHLNNITDEQIEGIATSGLDKLIVSVDGATQEVYQQYRVGGNIETVFDNMRKLVAAKKKHGSDLRIVWNFLVMKPNEHEMEMARQKAAEIGVEISFSIMRTNLKDDIIGKVEDNIEKDAKWIPESPQYNPYNLENKTRKNPITFCKRPWQETFINWNGDVFPCGCVVTEKQYSMGNIFDQSFEEVWNGDKYVAARKEILGQPNGIKTICHICKANGYYTP
ncbi:MAG: radical SAM protein [Nitrospinae bacterium CG11_big_fil_rev_8_21_14_0_20_56_8]|nr:MAG: radical SAM protein [Nitrospinae bacterium CG11_big_fil_rev_8_21_14_0_20_56_8]